MIDRTAVVLLTMALLCISPATAAAASSEGQRGELSVLREKIKAIQDEIAHSEESHEEIVDELASSDKAVSLAQRQLRDTVEQLREAEAQVRRLQSRQLVVENDLARMRKQLGDAIFRLYVEGGQGGARRFLSGDSPNQLSRDAVYLEQIARQRLLTIERARAAMAELEGLVRQAQARRGELQQLEKRRRAEQEALLSERRKQRDVLNQVSNQLRTQRKQMQSLQRDEARMEKLLRGLEKIARSRPQKPARSPSVSHSSAGSGESAVAVAPSGQKADTLASAFAALKGRLAWPVAGSIKARFGSPRAEGGSSWRGVFIKSASGADVRAVASGKIAFADWMRGFGNLVIIDHGNDYMTVYGNNESVFKNPGDEVQAGEVVASAGSSGGLDESGLYFEIRYRGQPQDPAKWMAAK